MKAEINSNEIESLYTEVLAGNRTALSKAITLCESNLEFDQEKSLLLLEKILPHSGESIRIGVSGIPGAGKSTLIESLGLYLCESHQLKVAVLAIDPSSLRNFGSILGDKTRMQKLSRSENAFIRPTASQSKLGGIGKNTYEAMLLCEAAKYDVILIETVGTGQSELSVHQLVDTFLMLQIVGAGDDIQGIKRGAIEWVDLILINKADNGLEDRAVTEAKNLEKIVHLIPGRHTHWSRKVLSCSALEHIGIDSIWESILSHQAFLKKNQYLQKTRDDQQRNWLYEKTAKMISDYMDSHPVLQSLYEDLKKQSVKKEINPFEHLLRVKNTLGEIFPFSKNKASY